MFGIIQIPAKNYKKLSTPLPSEMYVRNWTRGGEEESEVMGEGLLLWLTFNKI